MKKNIKELEGYILAFSSYLIWGILPIYWKQLSTLSAIEIMADRIFWSTLFLIVVIKVLKKEGLKQYFTNHKIRNSLIVTCILITVNWTVFIFAVNTGNMVQASLGYYINPLMSVLLGIIVLKEKLTKTKGIALIFASIGVVYLTVSYGVFPWISIVLATSFGLYGLLKKMLALDSLLSLLVELMLVWPISAVVLIWLIKQGNNHLFISNPLTVILILLAGVITVIPLYLFAEGAKKIPMSAIGFLQYIAPTMMLAIGVLVYGETFKAEQGVSFAFIWTGIIIYMISIIRDNKSKLNFKNK